MDLSLPLLGGYLSTFIVGSTLGFLGSGGSILMVPLLVYLFHFNTDLATSYSLVIVGVTAFLGAFRSYKNGEVRLTCALYLGIPGILTVLFFRNQVIPLIPTSFFLDGFEVKKDTLILVLLAFIMAGAGNAMLRRQVLQTGAMKTPPRLSLAITGSLIGLVTAFAGAGGGFLIVPALLKTGRVSIQEAIGTSLFIVALNSSSGFIGDLTANRMSFDFVFVAVLLLLSLSGMVFGSRIRSRISAEKMRHAFGIFLFLMALFILIQEFIVR